MAFRSRSYKVGRFGNIVTTGQVLKPNQPAFRVRGSGSHPLSATAVIPWTVEDYDIGSNFDLANNRFVAPVDGVYYFSHLNLAGANGNFENDVGLYINGTYENGTRSREDTGSSYWNTYNITAVLELSANDYVDLRVITNQVYHNSVTWTAFQGYLVG